MFITRSRFTSYFRFHKLVVLAVLFIFPTAYGQQPLPPSGAYDASPYLGQVRNTYVYGDIWERPNLSKRDRSMITVAVNQALYATNELRLHMGRALDNGVTQTELSEIIAHVMWYSGFPTGVNAARVVAEVFSERGLPNIPSGASSRQPPADLVGPVWYKFIASGAYADRIFEGFISPPRSTIMQPRWKPHLANHRF